MKTREVVYTGKDTINVVMEEEVAAMDEVVVTGIYERKRSDFTGSASTFTAEKLKEVGNQNILQSLKSLDPAFAIVESNEWGSDPDVYKRQEKYNSMLENGYNQNFFNI